MPPKLVAPIEAPKPVVDEVKEEYDAEEEELSKQINEEGSFK